MIANRGRVAAFLAEDTAVLAERILTQNPWLCEQIGVHWNSWSRALLDSNGLRSASLHLLGSAAIGFSLSPEKAGRQFRQISGTELPSDLDLAVVDDGLFRSCWDEMVAFERLGRSTYLNESDREHVYWGRIDDYRIPSRSPAKTQARTLIDSCRRSPEFRGYPASLRVYRRWNDLFYYVVRGLQALGRTIR